MFATFRHDGIERFIVMNQFPRNAFVICKEQSFEVNKRERDT